MAEGGDQEDRTEAATPRRLQQAREQGRFPLSRDVSLLAGLAAAVLALMMLAPAASRDMAAGLTRFLSDAHRMDLSDAGGGALRAAVAAGMRLAGPLILAVLAGGVASVLLQTGGAMHLGALRPDFRRVDPVAGLRRLVGIESLVEAGKSVLKVAVLAGACWQVLSASLGPVGRAALTDLALLPDLAMRLAMRVLLAVLAAQALIAGIDLVWVRLRHGRSLRMSRHEIREEMKETDGDPRVKQRLRQIRMQRARRRMLKAVPKATVVITNPTHFSVALAYDRATSAAPRLVAKGVDTMAARIREIAVANRVPVVANPPLARALYRVELDSEIPPEHYQAVAEIVAYVWGLGRRSRGRPA